LTERGSATPYLWVRFQYRFLTLYKMNWSQDRRVLRIHQTRAGSSANLLDTAYSAVLMGLASLRSFSGNQFVVPSIHWTSNSHPAVDNRG
jgi:hypothetical protein